MELIYTTHQSLANAHVLPPLWSMVLLVGALYGAIRLCVDVGRWIVRELKAAPVDLEPEHQDLTRSTGSPQIR